MQKALNDHLSKNPPQMSFQEKILVQEKALAHSNLMDKALNIFLAKGGNNSQALVSELSLELQELLIK